MTRSKHVTRSLSHSCICVCDDLSKLTLENLPQCTGSYIDNTAVTREQGEKDWTQNPTLRTPHALDQLTADSDHLSPLGPRFSSKAVWTVPGYIIYTIILTYCIFFFYKYLVMTATFLITLQTAIQLVAHKQKPWNWGRAQTRVLLCRQMLHYWIPLPPWRAFSGHSQNLLQIERCHTLNESANNKGLK